MSRWQRHVDRTHPVVKGSMEYNDIVVAIQQGLMTRLEGALDVVELAYKCVDHSRTQKQRDSLVMGNIAKPIQDRSTAIWGICIAHDPR